MRLFAVRNNWASLVSFVPCPQRWHFNCPCIMSSPQAAQSVWRMGMANALNLTVDEDNSRSASGCPARVELAAVSSFVCSSSGFLALSPSLSVWKASSDVTMTACLAASDSALVCFSNASKRRVPPKDFASCSVRVAEDSVVGHDVGRQHDIGLGEEEDHALLTYLKSITNSMGIVARTPALQDALSIGWMEKWPCARPLSVAPTPPGRPFVQC